MTGFHYTSFACWTRIKNEGLKPYMIYKAEFVPYVENGTIDAIWVWRDELGGQAHLGSVLYQAAMKETTRIVRLGVQYEVEDCFHFQGKLVEVPHTGLMGNWSYHTGREIGRLCIKPIFPDKIELLNVYNLEELVAIKSKPLGISASDGVNVSEKVG